MVTSDPPRAASAGPAPAPDGRPTPAPRSRHGLDGFVFFVADVQTGFGPFVAVYLTASKWTQTDIGLVLTVGGLVSLAAQIPAGALVDAVRSTRAAAAVALAGIGISALALAVWPVVPVVMASRVLQAAASCVLGVSMASLSLALVGRAGLGSRLGRNAAFASAGTGLAAAGMGACGYYLSNRAVFFVAAALVVPALVALLRIRAEDLRRPAPAGRAAAEPAGGSLLSGLAGLARNRALLVFAACVVLFQMANASMLPLAASMLTLRSSHAASAMVAAAIVVPQAIVTVLSPVVGWKAQSWGRKPLLVIGFAALPLRGLLFAATTDPTLLVAVQALDGISAAVLGVLVPLTIADVAGRSGRFNLAQGAIGCAVGIGASVSTTAVGLLADTLGSHTAFLAMAGVAALAVVVTALAMPETRPATAEGADPP
ncbi:MFS transporter [Lichenibacterium ramalinae]|uniref:MFS transporter n=1 Tax=Lichenibacterium ramalinae TaxID=2316527 RepID=UPI001FDF5808|nr:MFS transporter [Lichenibacterium ramalinae]